MEKKPQKSRKNPQKSPLPSRKKTPKKPQETKPKPQKLPTEEPQKTENHAPALATSSEEFGIVDTLSGVNQSEMKDLVAEAKAAEQEQTAADQQKETTDVCGQCGSKNIYCEQAEDPEFYYCYDCGEKTVKMTPTAPAAPVEVNDEFANIMATVWFSALRVGTQYAAKADLSPMTPDQRNRLSGAMKTIAAKHVPPVLLGLQEEMGLAGISVEIVMTNIKKPEQKTDGQQDNSSPRT